MPLVEDTAVAVPPSAPASAAAPRPEAVRFTAVTHAFETPDGPLEVLRDVDFRLARQEFVAVLGPSGCGKSTLLRLIAGLMTPSAGAIEVFGAPVDGPRDDIGIVFQKPTLLPWASVEDNIVFPMRHKTGRVGPADRARARELVRTVDLEGFGSRLPEQLSGGMQQRVGIARALFMNPDILLMDEPFSALDALTREVMGFELLALWESTRKTVLFVTHSIPEAILLADRILVMSGRPGRVIESIDVPLPRPRGERSLRGEAIADLASHLRERLVRRVD